MAEQRYDVIRYYMSGRKRLVKTGITLEQAQAHCSDPETSSHTCTSSVAKQRTRRYGPWFDGYTTSDKHGSLRRV